MFDRIIYKKTTLACLSFLVISLLGSGVYSLAFEKSSSNTTQTTEKQAQNKSNTTKTARVMANGDILIHSGLYGSAEQADGSYDFTPFFEYVKDWISSADLAIGVYKENRDTEDILIKNINGIKIAILGYSYGYNGMEANVADEDYEKHMSDLDEDKMKSEIQEAEKKADVTIVMPQMGTEYALEPTDEQVTLYHKMIDWGADVVFGGHPHVAEPSETLEKDGDKKFIIYSMGNFISNQRLETVDNIWTERGLLMDVTFEKKNNKTTIKTVAAHPTMVWVWSKGVTGSEGFVLSDYRTLVLEDFIEGGKYRDILDSTMQEKVDTAYQEMNELVNLQWD